MYAYCLRRVGRRDDVDDVVSEVYASVWRRLDDALDADVPLAWIYGIAYRTISNQRRGGARATRLAQRVSRGLRPRPSEDPGQLVATGEERRQVTRAVRRALDGLPAVDRELIRLSVWEELTHLEIAEVVDLTPASVRTRLFRARRRMERQLARRDVQPLPDTKSQHTAPPGQASRRSGGVWL